MQLRSLDPKYIAFRRDVNRVDQDKCAGCSAAQHPSGCSWHARDVPGPLIVSAYPSSTCALPRVGCARRARPQVRTCGASGGKPEGRGGEEGGSRQGKEMGQGGGGWRSV